MVAAFVCFLALAASIGAWVSSILLLLGLFGGKRFKRFRVRTRKRVRQRIFAPLGAAAGLSLIGCLWVLWGDVGTGARVMLITGIALLMVLIIFLQYYHSNIRRIH